MAGSVTSDRATDFRVRLADSRHHRDTRRGQRGSIYRGSSQGSDTLAARVVYQRLSREGSSIHPVVCGTLRETGEPINSLPWGDRKAASDELQANQPRRCRIATNPITVTATANANNGATICHAVGVSRARSRLVLMTENVVALTLVIIRGCEVRGRSRRRGWRPRSCSARTPPSFDLAPFTHAQYASCREVIVNTQGTSGLDQN